ncbi:hypothetical protein [Patulibacter sp. SYSU D01012]|uniref:hypothetical protein n=1 Tax=Patulibacter sp. SYSU D01012 TaxID=2817381 RepID=UPI001FEF5079|nr:hypothetical protein [Patulibacter sp. SYSU D01012]
MTIVRLDVEWQTDRRAEVLDAMEQQPDVGALRDEGGSLHVDLPGYGADAARSRAIELLHLATEASGVEPHAVRLLQDRTEGRGEQAL